MTSQIYQELYRHFHRHDYRLSNTFVYEWESDFFAQSSSGYFIEVEVKVSRGDYFRDFAKPKHDLFKNIRAGKTHHIKHQPTTGDQIGRVMTGKLVTSYNEKARWGYGGQIGWRSGQKNGKWGYWVNDYGHCQIEWREETLYAPATYIDIRPIDKAGQYHWLSDAEYSMHRMGGEWQIVCTSKEVKEEEAARIVQSISNGKMTGRPQYRRYDRDPVKDTPARSWTRDPRHSLETLLASKGCDVNKNWLILKKQ